MLVDKIIGPNLPKPEPVDKKEFKFRNRVLMVNAIVWIINLSILGIYWNEIPAIIRYVQMVYAFIFIPGLESWKSFTQTYQSYLDDIQNWDNQ